MKRRRGARCSVRHTAFHDRKPSFFQMPEGVGVEQAAQTLQHLVRTEPLRPVPQIEFVVETGRVLPLIVLQNGFGLVQRLHQLRFGRPARLVLLPHSAQAPVPPLRAGNRPTAPRPRVPRAPSQRDRPALRPVCPRRRSRPNRVPARVAAPAAGPAADIRRTAPSQATRAATSVRPCFRAARSSSRQSARPI